MTLSSWGFPGSSASSACFPQYNAICCTTPSFTSSAMNSGCCMLLLASNSWCKVVACASPACTCMWFAFLLMDQPCPAHTCTHLRTPACSTQHLGHLTSCCHTLLFSKASCEAVPALKSCARLSASSPQAMAAVNPIKHHTSCPPARSGLTCES